MERCPQQYVGAQELMLLEAYAQYKNGYLPNAGGWIDQPMKFIEALKVIERYITRLQELKDRSNVS